MISELLALLRAPARAERTGARSLVGCEAVEQAGTARALQRVLTATARAMRGVPGVHVPGVLEPGTVMVTHDGRALTALRPVPAGGIATGRGEEALRVRAGQNIVHVDGVAAAADRLAFLGQSRLLGDIGRIRVEILHALCHHHALGILPWTLADSFARVDAGGPPGSVVLR